MRLFAAIPLNPAVSERLLALRLRLAAPNDGLRWSPPEQWHVTLRFFGDIEASCLPAIEGAIAAIPWAPVALSLTQLGLFRAKGILFAAVESTLALAELHAALEKQIPGLDPIMGKRSFHPHITLARARNKAGLRTLEKLAKPELPALGTQMRWAARELLLYRSELTPEGAQYEVLERFSATGEAAE